MDRAELGESPGRVGIVKHRLQKELGMAAVCCFMFLVRASAADWEEYRERLLVVRHHESQLSEATEEARRAQIQGVVILEAWPVYLYLNSRFQGGAAEVSVTPLLMGVSGAAILTVLATWLPLRAGIRKIQSVDF